MKRKKLIITATVFIVLIAAYIKFFAYLPIEGTVVDAETKQPIEGAAVLVEWSITPMAWLGMPTTTSYRVIETMSDKNGKFKINAYVLNPIVNKPHLAIYKAGYVCWSNELIFPDKRERTEFKWQSGNYYMLEKFKEQYSYDEHYDFVNGAARPYSESEKKHLFLKMYDDGERAKVIKERDMKMRGYK